MEQWTDSKLGKEHDEAAYCHPAYLTYMQSTCRLDAAHAGFKIAGRYTNNLRYAGDTTLMTGNVSQRKGSSEQSFKDKWKLVQNQDCREKYQ